MNKIVGEGIKTFSIGFKEKGFSEIPYSRKVSSMISSDHMEIIVTPKDIMNNIETVIWYRETPISEVSDIPIYLLSKAASQVVKVVLTGEGGDEVFGGYKKYVFEKIANYSGLLANSYVRSLYRNKIAERLIPQRLGTAIELLAERDKYQRFYKWFSFFHEEELQNMIVKNKRHLLNSPNVFEQLVKIKEFKTSIEEMRYLDIKVWLPDNLLLRGDRMSMACSLEARVPFLDHRIVEMSFSLPLHLKINNFSGKYIIKKIAEKYLDRGIIYRKKIGFEVPVSEWFRTDLKDLLVSHLMKDNSFCSNYIEKYKIEEMIHEHVSAKRDHHKKLWILLNLELWHDKFLRN